MSVSQRVIGSGEGEVTLAADPAEVAAAGAAVAFMRGKLKAEGPAGAVLDSLRSGAVDAAFADG